MEKSLRVHLATVEKTGILHQPSMPNRVNELSSDEPGDDQCVCQMPASQSCSRAGQ